MASIVMAVMLAPGRQVAKLFSSSSIYMAAGLLHSSHGLPISGPHSTQNAPRVWLLQGPLRGDNMQVLALGQALGWPCTVKQLKFNKKYRPFLGRTYATLAGVDLKQSDVLAPPWPDLVIAVGRRSAAVAQWICKQSRGHCRHVHIGRPKASLSRFDLLISTPQYGIPDHANVVQLAMPPVLKTRGQDSEASLERWRTKFAALPRPWIALVIGGDSPPYYLDAATAAMIGQTVSRQARAEGGGLLVTTSPRTTPEATAALMAAIDAPAYKHIFVKGSDNPYPAYLAFADRFVVTAESVSMLTEACQSGRPVDMLPLPMHQTPPPRHIFQAMKQAFGARRVARRHQGKPRDILDRLYDQLIASGWIRQPRDIARFVQTLEARGLANRFGTKPLSATPTKTLMDADFAEAVRRVRALLEIKQ